jgi:hypothetical protein
MPEAPPSETASAAGDPELEVDLGAFASTFEQVDEPDDVGDSVQRAP